MMMGLKIEGETKKLFSKFRSNRIEEENGVTTENGS